jgi:hypothetical protein
LFFDTSGPSQALEKKSVLKRNGLASDSHENLLSTAQHRHRFAQALVREDSNLMRFQYASNLVTQILQDPQPALRCNDLLGSGLS